jgi:hypothetical protein
MWWKLALAVTLTIAFGAVVAIWAMPSPRRPDITDPVVLAGMPLKELSDVEVETLIRAEFRSAENVTISSEVKTENGEWRKPTTITDRATLDGLANCFAVGSDDEKLPRYRHPGTLYTNVEFAGPSRPNFVFIYEKRIYVYGGTQVNVATPFARKLAGLLDLPLFSDRSETRNPITNDPRP